MPKIAPQLIVLCLLSGSSEAALTPAAASRSFKAPRVEDASKRRLGELRQAFEDGGAAWPPRGIFLRAFKSERRLELWAASGQGAELIKVLDWQLCAQSGVLGPKRQEGDGQIPEGVYHLNRFNPWSRFHLSLGLNYPNPVDRARSQGGDPGSDIFIHGACVSVGCLAITDGPIELLYLTAHMARQGGQRRISAHLFPCRFGEPACELALSRVQGHAPDTLSLYAQLRAVYEAFERVRRAPRVRVDSSGYRL